MSDTYTFHEDGSCTVVSSDGTLQINLPNYNPATQIRWQGEQDVKDFVNKHPNPKNLWLTIADLPTADELSAITAKDKRIKRNQLLADSDWTQMNDSPLTDEAKTSWATYRQSLRDITADESWPDVTFPATP